MKQEEQMLIMNKDIAEDYISLLLKRKVMITDKTWNEVHEVMEDGCREILNDLANDIFKEIQREETNIGRN